VWRGHLYRLCPASAGEGRDPNGMNGNGGGLLRTRQGAENRDDALRIHPFLCSLPSPLLPCACACAPFAFALAVEAGLAAGLATRLEHQRREG
jgi:hypothetical protein